MSLSAQLAADCDVQASIETLWDRPTARDIPAREGVYVLVSDIEDKAWYVGQSVFIKDRRNL